MLRHAAECRTHFAVFSQTNGLRNYLWPQAIPYRTSPSTFAAGAMLHGVVKAKVIDTVQVAVFGEQCRAFVMAGLHLRAERIAPAKNMCLLRALKALGASAKHRATG